MFKDIDWKDLGERCVATFFETFLAMITAEALTGSDGDLLRSAFVGYKNRKDAKKLKYVNDVSQILKSF